MEATVTTPTIAAATVTPVLSPEERCQTVCRIANEFSGVPRSRVGCGSRRQLGDRDALAVEVRYPFDEITIQANPLGSNECCDLPY